MNPCSSENCMRCTKCCSNYLPLTNKEISLLRQTIKKNKIKPVKNTMIQNWYDVCPFLDGNTCTIYNIRPLICRTFTCSKLKYKDFSNMDELLKEPRKLVNLRKELFK